MPDVNVLVYTHREETHTMPANAEWLTLLFAGPEPFVLSELSRIFDPPSSPSGAFRFLDAQLELPGCCLIRPGPDHWQIVADAAHAAFAIESGCQWVTADTDFTRFAPAKLVIS